jgi:hypothetical protein
MNETLRCYTRRATIASITDEDVIRCFQNRLFSKHMYHDFIRNRPTTTMELCDRMAQWVDQEDEENYRFPKRNHNKQGNGQFDKSQRNQTKKSLSTIRMARSRGTTTPNSRKSCTNNARYTRSRDTRSSSVSPSASHSMHHPSLKQESIRTRRTTRRVTSQGLKASRIRRTSSTSSSAETVDSLPSVRRS